MAAKVAAIILLLVIVVPYRTNFAQDIFEDFVYIRHEDGLAKLRLSDGLTEEIVSYEIAPCNGLQECFGDGWYAVAAFSHAASKFAYLRREGEQWWVSYSELAEWLPHEHAIEIPDEANQLHMNWLPQDRYLIISFTNYDSAAFGGPQWTLLQRYIVDTTSHQLTPFPHVLSAIAFESELAFIWQTDTTLTDSNQTSSTIAFDPEAGTLQTISSHSAEAIQAPDIIDQRLVWDWSSEFGLLLSVERGYPGDLEPGFYVLTDNNIEIIDVQGVDFVYYSTAIWARQKPRFLLQSVDAWLVYDLEQYAIVNSFQKLGFASPIFVLNDDAVAFESSEQNFVNVFDINKEQLISFHLNAISGTVFEIAAP